MSNKLELTWYGKDKKLQIEPRLLIENKELSNTEFDADTENMLIHGDNLLALKALESKYAGKVKCIYIDPPYNTGSAFEHYDDNVEHSQWLSLIKPRLEILRNLLSNDGSIWISIDDDEQAYLKVLCDEVFGRSNFVANCIWHKKHTRSNDARWFSDNHDYIMVWARDKTIWNRNLLPRTKNSLKGYNNPDNDKRGIWASGPCHVKTPNPKDIYMIKTPSGREVYPPSGTSWRFSKEKFQELIEDNRIWFGENGTNIPRYKRFLTDVQDGFVPTTLWFREEVGDNQEAKKEVKQIDNKEVFSTPKPERLIERIITLASNEGDLILDSFLGSGTTSAVAHKMNRRWIGIEMGNHAYTHSKVRLDKVISGEDRSGISESVNWQDGGGYKFYELAPSLINIDSFDEPVINKEYSADMLASAVALHEGFNYQPSEDVFWKQSIGNENSYLFVTTRHLTSQYIDSIKDTMSDNEYLIIACRSFDAGLEKAYKQITIKKIPNMLLAHCEFDKDNYNLNIINPPIYDEFEEDEADE
ncbi:site-specific DNA-methyltransferase [Listeria marthii]|uniref:site-specific DNA-methyltransferase n=1 Tax=Listeria marthii TaxID=529731 RepID=UPI0018871F43|nr:site-specific DNA-methyltransferase [Listeria marthii]MBF2478544.1 site-specific DNA-methyltransferase [Listeria marthii]MBF2495153.1 site-specific DNA-methyltransferase [Listeria marthii]